MRRSRRSSGGGWVGRSVELPLPVNERQAICQPPASCHGVIWLKGLQSFITAPAAAS